MTTEQQHIWTIIMAGGIGSRFWPMSQADNPKQFIDIMGTGQSMLQSTFARMEQVCPRNHIVVVTGESHAARVRDQVPDLEAYQVLAEPMRRNTAPCVAYAAAVINSIDPHATVVITPSDHAVFGLSRFAADLTEAIQVSQNHGSTVTIGAQPTNPNSKYGYIQYAEGASLVDGHNRMHPVVTFTEKPPLEMARQFIASGEFFWNTGIQVWPLTRLMDAYRQHMPQVAALFFGLGADSSAEQVHTAYSTVEAQSIDFGIMEHAEGVLVLEASFGWSDIETWASLYDTYPHDGAGNAVVSGNAYLYDVSNTVVHIPHHQTIVVKGLDGYIIASGADTLLICPRADEEQLFRFSNDVELGLKDAGLNQDNEKK